MYRMIPVDPAFLALPGVSGWDGSFTPTVKASVCEVLNTSENLKAIFVTGPYLSVDTFGGGDCKIQKNVTTEFSKIYMGISDIDIDIADGDVWRGGHMRIVTDGTSAGVEGFHGGGPSSGDDGTHGHHGGGG